MSTVRALDIAFKVFMACMWLMLWGVSGLWFSIPTLAIFVIRGIVKSREPNIPQLIQQYSDNESQHLDDDETKSIFSNELLTENHYTYSSGNLYSRCRGSD